MAMPANVDTGRVEGRFIVGVADGPDPDDEPDAIPAVGTVTFTASVPYLPNPTSTPSPATLLKVPIVAVLDGEGFLCTPDPTDPAKAGARGIRLVATDDPDLSVQGWTWTVTYSFQTVNGVRPQIASHSIALPGGATVDLTSVVRVPSSTGIGTAQAEALAASAQAAAAEASAAAVAASEAAQATDTGVATLVTTGGATTTALDTGYRRSVSVKEHGATGTGTADDTPALQAAIDTAAALGVPTNLPGGTYRITAPLTLREGTSLVLDADTVMDGTGLGGSYALVASGGFVDAQALTAGVAAGAQTVPVPDSTAYAPGDIVRIRSDKQLDATQPREGEMGVVHEVSAGSIMLAASVMDSYDVTDGATIERLSGADSISVTGGTWIGHGGDGARWAAFTGCTRIKIHGVTLKGWKERGINFASCADASVTATSIDGCDQTGLGYGITISNATSWLTITGCTFSRFRQAIAGGGSASDYGRPRFVRIIGNSFHGNRGVNTHSGGQYWVISDNHFQAGHEYDVGAQITWNGAEVTVTGNVLIDATRIGILIQPTHFAADGVVVNGNHVVRAGSVGIALLASGAAITSAVVSNNVVTGPAGQGIYLHAAQAGSSVSEFTIAGNVVTDAQNHGIDVYAALDSVTGGTITGNRVTVSAPSSAGVRLLAGDGNALARVAVTGNSVAGGTTGIAGIGGPTDCWVDSNLATGSSAGVTGFASTDIGANKTV